jgi:class 3 adenylate cyclase
MSKLPGGTVTFLFTDIEGSTRLLQELGGEYVNVIRDHRRIVRETLGKAGGTEIDMQGDAFFFSFPRARDAARGAVETQRALNTHRWPSDADVRIRMGIHTGEPTVGEEGYLGLDVVRAARICGAGHGGQILVSETTRALLGNELPEGSELHDLGQANLKDIQHERVFELIVEGGPSSFPPLKTAADAPRSMGEQLAEKIQRHVEEQLEEAFSKSKPVRVPMMSGLLVALLSLVFIGAATVILVLILKSIF